MVGASRPRWRHAAVTGAAAVATAVALAAGEGSGTTGPNLDTARPSYGEVVTKVTDGAGIMPSFKDRLSKAQIDAIAKFVASVAG